MIGIEQRLEVRAQGSLATVQFYAVERRFGHEIRIMHRGADINLRTDDRLDDQWPPCPPIQDVHFEQREECSLLFGVGMSGKTHYSVSMAAEQSGRIRFEFAANIKSQPEFLGTTYRPIHKNSGGWDSLNKLNLGELILGDQNSETTLSQGEKADQTLAVKPRAASYGSVPCTVQWGFEIRVGCQD